MLAPFAVMLAAVVGADSASAVMRPSLLPHLNGQTSVDVIVAVAPGEVGAVLAELPASDFVVRRRYLQLSGFAGVATRAGLEQLSADRRVTAIQLDDRGHAFTAESGAAIGSTRVHRELGITGRGVTVAVLDTGVDDQHPDLDGGLAAQQCFVLGGCGPQGADVGDRAPEGNGHGTHVTGTITGDGVVAPPGIAPGARVVVIRVFNDQSVGRVSDWSAALDWLLAHRASLGVRAVNMSLGTDTTYPGACDADQPLLADAIGQLRDAGVVVFAASGNDGRADQMSAPACVAAAVAVGATYDSSLGREPDTGTYKSGCVDEIADAGTIACFSNASDQLDLLAPGSRIRAAAPGAGSVEKRGTSQASPHATAVAALMLELDSTLSADELERTLKESGRPTLDARSGRVTPAIDAWGALRAVQQTFCARHSSGERCLLELPCDGGSCTTGTCASGRCAIVLPALEPMPAFGCSAGAGGLLLCGALAVLVRAWRRRSLQA